MFEGRVKTLHPKIHGGILHKRDDATHVAQAKEYGIEGIDLVCVNLYPFKETTIRTDDFGEIIENIDIGGPAMVRSAAKNFKDVLIVTSVLDYDEILKRLKEKSDDYEFRRSLMIKAFEHTAAYDSMIANYMNDRFNGIYLMAVLAMLDLSWEARFLTPDTAKIHTKKARFMSLIISLRTTLEP